MDNIRGAAFMVFSMLCFAIEDAFIKLLADAIPVGQILSIICLGGLIAFLGWSALRGERLWQPAYLDTKVLLRSVCDVSGSIMFMTSLTLIPLTTASAVIQATPLVVAMGLQFFLANQLAGDAGWRFLWVLSG